MISFDGVGADALARHVAAGDFTAGGYQAMTSTGTSAGRVITVEPSLTAPAHISIITGAPPQVNGIVSNTFRTAGGDVSAWMSGFSAEITAETLWEAARRQGKRVGIVTYPGADAKTARRSGDWGLIWTDPVTRSRIVKLKRSDFESEWLPPGWRGEPDPQSFSPVLRARVPWTVSVEGQELARREIVFVAQDTTDDGRENYDRITAHHDGRPLPAQGAWFPVHADVSADQTTTRYGSWSRVLRADSSLSETVIYWGAISRVEGYPESYRRMIETEVGFWPGDPDGWSVGQWLAGKDGITPEIWSEQMLRFSDFLQSATALSIQKMPFDLLLGYDPTVDETEHQFLLVNDLQAASTPENRQRAAAVRRLAYANLDRSLNRLLSAIDRSDTALVVVSDHGLSPIDTRVAVNKVLVDNGFAQQVDERIAPQSRWAAFTSGHIAHIYRFGDADEEETVRLVTVLTALRSPDGRPVFEKVQRKGPQDHANSGDIVAYAWPPFAMSSSLRGETFEKTDYYGQHGGLSTHPEFHAFFAATGSGVAAGVQIPQIHQTEIARYVSALLGIEPPKQAR